MYSVVFRFLIPSLVKKFRKKLLEQNPNLKMEYCAEQVCFICLNFCDRKEAVQYFLNNLSWEFNSELKYEDESLAFSFGGDVYIKMGITLE